MPSSKDKVTFYWILAVLGVLVAIIVVAHARGWLG